MKTMGCLFLGCISIMLIASCATAPTRLKADYGTSYKLAKFNQILHPEAAGNLEPVDGFDGRAAQETSDKYRKNFAQPLPQPRFVLPVGGLAR